MRNEPHLSNAGRFKRGPGALLLFLPVFFTIIHAADLNAARNSAGSAAKPPPKPSSSAGIIVRNDTHNFQIQMPRGWISQSVADSSVAAGFMEAGRNASVEVFVEEFPGTELDEFADLWERQMKWKEPELFQDRLSSKFASLDQARVLLREYRGVRNGAGVGSLTSFVLSGPKGFVVRGVYLDSQGPHPDALRECVRSFLVTAPPGSRQVVQQTGQRGGIDPESIETQRMKALGLDILRFRQQAISDSAKALEYYATEAALQKFKDFNEAIWIDTAPSIGWSYFFNVSLLSLGGAKGEKPVAAFYNPWCDIFLITQWESGKDSFRLSDAELVLGDWVRRKGELPVDIVPVWLRGNGFRVETLGRAVAESISAFESIFPHDGDAGDWRGKLALNNKELLDKLHYKTIYLLTMENLLKIKEFRAPDSENPVRKAVKEETINFLLAAGQGQMAGQLQYADRTTPAMKDLLSRLSPETAKTLSVVFTIIREEDALVFLTPAYNADFCLGLHLAMDSGRLALRRIDFIYYPGIYEAGKTRS